MADRLPMSACRTIVSELLPTGHPTIEHAARRLGIPVRTLQRRLRERGQSYGELVDATRRRRACCLLARPGTRVADVAKALGYADASSFSRAFRRWTGMAPREFRRRARQAATPSGRAEKARPGDGAKWPDFAIAEE